MQRNRLWSLIAVVLGLMLFATGCNTTNKLGDLTVDINEFKDVPFAGDTLKVLVSASEDFTITPQEDWLIPNMKVASARTRLTIRVLPNFSKQERSGSLIVTTPGKEVKIDVRQQPGSDDLDISTYPYEIPIIFHVMYNEDDQNKLIEQNKDKRGLNYPDFKPVNSELLQGVLEKVNLIYRGIPELPTNLIERTNYEKDNAEKLNANVKFVMATEDKDGHTLSPVGVKRYPITEKSLDPVLVMRDAKGGKYHSMSFPINKYINVFIFPFTSTSTTGITLGIAHLPHVPSQFPLEGLGVLDTSVASLTNYNHCVTINSKVFEPLVYTSLYQGSNAAYYTLAHELGHALGLKHVFSEVEKDGSTVMADACVDTDHCIDTYSYNRISYDRNRLPVSNTDKKYSEYEGLRRRTNCTGTAFVSTNIMDYEISWNDRLTSDQLKRLRHVLYYSFNVPGVPKLATPRALRSGESVVAEPTVSRCPDHHHDH